MDQDVMLGVTTTVTQADLPYLREAGRLGEYAVVYRVSRNQLGGGFGDQDKHPFAWGVLVYVDAQLGRVYSARGAGREWNSLDRLERWLRDRGFWYWWTRNDLEPLGANEATEEDEEDTPSLGPLPPGDLLPPGPSVKAGPRGRRRPGIVRIGDHRQQLFHQWDADRRDDAELGHVRTDQRLRA